MSSSSLLRKSHIAIHGMPFLQNRLSLEEFHLLVPAVPVCPMRDPKDNNRGPARSCKSNFCRLDRLQLE
jgi:hypothetical protein